MGNPTLQELSRQYAEGGLSTNDYRQKRTVIINEITGDQASSISSIPSASSQPAMSSGLNPAIKIAVVALVFIVVIVIVYLNRKDADNKATVNQSSKAMVLQHLVPHMLQTQETRKQPVSIT